jgi:hypothetical protein
VLVKPPIEVTTAEPEDHLPVPYTTWLQKYLSGNKVQAYNQLTWENAEEFVTSRLSMFDAMTRTRR